MKIALIGYGKMGKEIEAIALKEGHEVVLRINSSNKHEMTAENLAAADAAIEFTTPETVFNNLLYCFQAGVPVVTGTTGWLDKLPAAREACEKFNGSALYASNFSIGVQVFMELNRRLAVMMDKLPAYDISINEIHHLQKLDKPSGTAISLADDLLKHLQRKKQWQLNTGQGGDKNNLLITSERIDKVVGTHTITCESDIDKIVITHEAKNRKGFASGAIVAANWLTGKKGFYSMSDCMKEILG
jgi:4-hydroxy-tetrahydrodipicolinate reductase